MNSNHFRVHLCVDLYPGGQFITMIIVDPTTRIYIGVITPIINSKFLCPILYRPYSLIQINRDPVETSWLTVIMARVTHCEMSITTVLWTSYQSLLSKRKWSRSIRYKISSRSRQNQKPKNCKNRIKGSKVSKLNLFIRILFLLSCDLVRSEWFMLLN